MRTRAGDGGDDGTGRTAGSGNPGGESSPTDAGGAPVRRNGRIDEAPDDALLAARARNDPRAIAPLYDRYFDSVYRFCHRRLGDHDRAAEATAQVFTRALAALPRYAATGSFRAWLFAIAHNAIVDGYRERRDDAPLEVAAGLADPRPSPEDAALAADGLRTMTDVLARLPTEQRRIVELRLAGLTGPEIAEATGRSLSSVKRLQFRAYARLRRLLGDETTPGKDPS